MFGRLVVFALVGLCAPLLAGALASPVPAVHSGPGSGTSFTFAETISVSGGYGSYAGYTETDVISGTVTITLTHPGGIDNATYLYSGVYANSTGTNSPWSVQGNFTFSTATYSYVSGTDDQTGDNGSEVWFYMNDSLPVGATFAPLFTEMTVESRSTSYPLGTAAGTDVSTIYADGTGTYVRNDSYGVFNATYDWRSYFDPATGLIIAYDYTELDANGRGDGFVYTDTLSVTRTTYPLTAVPAPPTYPVTFTESGLPSGTSWAVTFNGESQSGTGGLLSFSDVENGTYLFGARLAGYTVSPSTGFVTVDGAAAGATIAFTASSAGPPAWESLLLLVVLVVVVVVVLIAVAIALARRSRRSRIPRHSFGGQVPYGATPPGPAPPPISLRPADQPQIQQVVVQEVVKVNCRYCGSLIDSTAEKCPFCGATRS